MPRSAYVEELFLVFLGVVNKRRGENGVGGEEDEKMFQKKKTEHNKIYFFLWKPFSASSLPGGLTQSH